jgi:uncharacterized protein
MSNKYLGIVIIVIVLVVGWFVISQKKQTPNVVGTTTPADRQITNAANDNPLSIVTMRIKSYPGSTLTIEQILSPGSNYQQYIASYLSDGLKIYGLLTVPNGQKPVGGWPVIIFNHGYIPPQQYRTTERYVAYVAAIAQSGYIVFKSDYRGNGSSEGTPEGAYYSPAYATDVLNAVSTLKQYKDANPNKIGMWGHSMGGNITLRDLVINPKDIKVAVIWGGVVGSYDDLMNNWQRRVSYQPPPSELIQRNNYRQSLVQKYGTPATNPAFWNAIDPTTHLADITSPIQLHTGGDDEEVPVAFSVGLYQKLQQAGKIVEYYNYPGGDHNIASPNFELAMQRSIEFFNKYLKG